MSGLQILAHYKAYFGEQYIELKNQINQQSQVIERLHGVASYQQFARSFAINERLKQFWERFFFVASSPVNTDRIYQAWQNAKEAVDAALEAKRINPLDPIPLSNESIVSIEAYNAICDQLDEYSAVLQQLNVNVENRKQAARTADLNQINNELQTLRLSIVRHQPNVDVLCNSYLKEIEEKVQTESRKDAARAALDHYRSTIFPRYESAINAYLNRFNAGFTIGRVSPSNNRGGSTCNYSVIVNNYPVELMAPSGQPSFKNTLSAGDRSVLALAFFFASIDLTPNAGANKIIIIDDPMTSLDEHRSLVTVHELVRLAQRVEQVIVLSHSSQFLFALWQRAEKSRLPKISIKLARAQVGSQFVRWDISRQALTTHDLNHELVTKYISGTSMGNEREVASALRPIMERFIRVSYPIQFPPGDLLGPFAALCRSRHGQPDEILSPDDTIELQELLDYANQFHHDSNVDANTVIISDTELLQFSSRTLEFARR